MEKKKKKEKGTNNEEGTKSQALMASCSRLPKGEHIDGDSSDGEDLNCHYGCKKGHTIENSNLGVSFVPKGVFQLLPKCNQFFTNPQGPNEGWVPSLSC